MSISFRDRALGGSKRHQSLQNTMPVYPIEDLPSPFGDSAPNFSESELRETAYEILVGACRTSGGKPLTFISQSEKGDRSSLAAAPPSPSLHRTLTSTAASKVKKALGLKTSSSKRKGESVSQVKSKRALTTGELMRLQMRVSEQTDTRIRRALLRIAAGQVQTSFCANLISFQKSLLKLQLRNCGRHKRDMIDLFMQFHLVLNTGLEFLFVC